MQIISVKRNKKKKTFTKLKSTSIPQFEDSWFRKNKYKIDFNSLQKLLDGCFSGPNLKEYKCLQSCSLAHVLIIDSKIDKSKLLEFILYIWTHSSLYTRHTICF